MRETARLARTNAGSRFLRQSRSATLIALFCLAILTGSVPPGVHAQSAEPSKAQLRANIKSAAEKLNDIASAGPDMIRAMFAGKTPSASLLALDEKSMAVQAQLENAVLAAQKAGALSDDESKELARLGELAKKTRDPVKEDIETLKAIPDLPIVGRDPAVRLAPKSQQDEAINHAEAAKRRSESWWRQFGNCRSGAHGGSAAHRSRRCSAREFRTGRARVLEVERTGFGHGAGHGFCREVHRLGRAVER